MIKITPTHVEIHSSAQFGGGRVKRNSLTLKAILYAARDCHDLQKDPPKASIAIHGDFWDSANEEWSSWVYDVWVWITGDVKIGCQFVPWQEVQQVIKELNL